MADTTLDITIIETHNSKTIGIADSSIYDPSITISNATIEITPPGGFNKVSLPFTPKSINIFNSNNVGITNACDFEGLIDMPDGIWILKYSISPNLTMIITRTYLRTTMIECRLQAALLKVLMNEGDFVSREKQRKYLLDIQILIEGAISAANKMDDRLSMDFYNRASKMIDDFNNQKCNNCGLL